MAMSYEPRAVSGTFGPWLAARSLDSALQPGADRLRDLGSVAPRRASHVAAFGIDARFLGIAVLHQEIDVGNRGLVVELAVHAEDSRRGLVEKSHVLQ